MAKRRRHHRQDTVAAGDPLSSLPDDILRRILFFAPAKEAASTAVLSRRWRKIWCTSGAVNLDTRSYSGDLANHPDSDHRLRGRFLRGAKAALAGARGRVTRLTVHVEVAAASLLNRRRLPAVFSHLAVRRVEEIHASVEPAVHIHGIGHRIGLCKLSFRLLPSETLRVLRITNFNNLKPPEPGAVFPRLTELHLQGCMVNFSRLQRIVDAAPQLATLHLDATSFPGVDHVPMARWEAKFLRGYGIGADSSKPVNGEEPLAASNVIQADLHVIVHRYYHRRVDVPFWQFVHDFSAAKVLRLKMESAIVEDVAIFQNMSQQDDLQIGDKFFHNLERLELEGRFDPRVGVASVTIANFLRFCPMVRDLCLKLKICPIRLEMPSVGTLAQLDFNKSIDRFKCRRRAMVLLGGDDDWNSHKVSDIPGLSEYSFDCLQSSLRRVGLQFWMDEPNCFGMQLVKFFTNNAVLLEEMQIDDGNQMMREHMNRKIQRWVSAKKRNPLTVTSFEEFYHPSKRQKR